MSNVGMWKNEAFAATLLRRLNKDWTTTRHIKPLT